MLHSYKPGSFFVAALAAFAVQESALAHIEALPGYRLPFVEACLAQGDALGAGLQAGFAVGLQVNDVVHLIGCSFPVAFDATKSNGVT